MRIYPLTNRLPWPVIHILALAVATALLALAGLLWPRPALAATAPTLLEPADTAVLTGVNAPPLGVPTLRWSPVPDASSYRVEISTSQGMANPIQYTTYATSLTPMQALADSTYYWRVQAKIGRDWQDFSGVWSFVKDWDGNGAIKPILLAPANDPTGASPLLSFNADHFRWEPVTGAASYLFEISRSDTFSTIEYAATTLAPRHTPSKRLENSPYFWRVTPLDQDENPGATSDTWRFDIFWSVAPQPLAPANDATLRFLPRFSWTAVEGAQSYTLEISTENDFASPTTYATRNTDFTPGETMTNNEDYYWRVKAIVYSGKTAIASPPSEPRRFVAAWKQPPQLLTPANDISIGHTYPFFSWTPVPGAERYQIQIDDDTGFGKPLEDETLFNATAYTQPEWKDIPFGGPLFWRVRAIDAQGNTTDWASPFMFTFSKTPPPNLVYPLPYYTPDAEMPVHTNRAAPWPVFIWDTTHSYETSQNGPAAFVMPDYYHLQVSEQHDFATIVFSAETAGQAAAPTADRAFYPESGKRYYWRVQAMKGDTPMGGAIQREVVFDPSLSELPIAPAATPIHPADGFEAVAIAPVLGWLPVVNAARYEVQISRGPAFRADALLEQANALYPYYVPGQNQKTALGFGTYWWRVRAIDGGNNPLGDWSTPRRFNLSLDLMTGNPHDYIAASAPSLLGMGAGYDPALSLVASSPPDPVFPYDLGNLHVIQDNSHGSGYSWIIAFGVNMLAVEPMSYAIYFDVDHVKDNGAPSAPLGGPIPDALYRPEYVVYVDRSGHSVSATLYTWMGGTWFRGNLQGGYVRFDPITAAVQVHLPYTVLVNQSNTFAGSLAVSVFSLDSGNSVKDSIPAQGQVDMADNPALVSDMLMPLYPFDTPLDNPFVFREMPSLRWRMPTFDSVDGYQVEIARDINFTTVLQKWETYESGTASLYAVAPAAFHSGKAYGDDESYYWRVRVRHERFGSSSAFDYGPWSPPMRFKLTSYPVGNPTTSLGDLVAGTPTFLWERVEGAAGYTIRIGTDSELKSTLIDKRIDGNSYTPPSTLADGTYYWRVAMRRARDVYGQWSPIYSFTKRSLAPQPLDPIGDKVINHQPTFSWAAMITNTVDVNGLRLAASRYRLQWANNPEFVSAVTVDTAATAYTVVERRSLEDGWWYWRVAVLDGEERQGDFSPPQRFYKEYLKPDLLSPSQGSASNALEFAWSPLPGAAYYRFEIADNPSFSRSKTTNTVNTRFTPLDALEAAEYFWRVQMVDQDGKPGPQIDGRVATSPQSELERAVFLPLVHSY